MRQVPDEDGYVFLKFLILIVVICDITTIFSREKDMTKDMTNGSPMKLILGFSVPLLFGFFYFSSFTI